MVERGNFSKGKTLWQNSKAERTWNFSKLLQKHQLSRQQHQSPKEACKFLAFDLRVQLFLLSCRAITNQWRTWAEKKVKQFSLKFPFGLEFISFWVTKPHVGKPVLPLFYQKLHIKRPKRSARKNLVYKLGSLLIRDFYYVLPSIVAHVC